MNVLLKMEKSCHLKNTHNHMSGIFTFDKTKLFSKTQLCLIHPRFLKQ